MDFFCFGSRTSTPLLSSLCSLYNAPGSGTRFFPGANLSLHAICQSFRRYTHAGFEMSSLFPNIIAEKLGGYQIDSSHRTSPRKRGKPRGYRASLKQKPLKANSTIRGRDPGLAGGITRGQPSLHASPPHTRVAVCCCLLFFLFLKKIKYTSSKTERGRKRMSWTVTSCDPSCIIHCIVHGRDGMYGLSNLSSSTSDWLVTYEMGGWTCHLVELGSGVVSRVTSSEPCRAGISSKRALPAEKRRECRACCFMSTDRARPSSIAR